MKSIFCLIIVVIVINTVVAQWSTDPSQNLKVAGGGINPDICTDGSGGCFIVWETGAAGNRRLLRIQRLDRLGFRSFPENGISLSGEELDQSSPFFLRYGGDGTALVLFYDVHRIGERRLAKTLVQRIDTTGALLWGKNAVRPTQSDSSQTPVALLADSKGGAFVFWAEDSDGDGIQEMFGNRLTANGQLLWGLDGKKFADYAYDRIRTHLVNDGTDGLFTAFTQISGIVIQHMDGNGKFLWPDPIQMTVGIWGALASDNMGGFIWAAHEQIAYRPPAGIIYRTRVFRYNHAGVSMWAAEGVAITDSTYQQTFTPEVVVNGQQDIAVIYRVLSTPYDNVHVQRISFNGELLLEYGGVPVSMYPSTRAYKQTSLGTNGNIIVVWWDGRVLKGDIYGQSVAQDGERNWGEDVAISLQPDVEWNHRVCSDGNGGCIVTWYEIGMGSGWGIFAQQISSQGRLGHVLPTLVNFHPSEKASLNIPFAFNLFPNPFTDTVRLNISIVKNLPITIRIFDLTGKTIRMFHDYARNDGKLSMLWDGCNKEGKPASSGIYLLQIQAGGHAASQKIILIR